MCWSEFECVGVSASELERVGVSASELECVGVSESELERAGDRRVSEENKKTSLMGGENIETLASCRANTK